jgi:hypothetical protein
MLYNIKTKAAAHPLVYSSTPYPQWSSGYDFRLSLTPTSRGRPGFDSLLRSKSHTCDSSSIVNMSSGIGSPVSPIFLFSLGLPYFGAMCCGVKQC